MIKLTVFVLITLLQTQDSYVVKKSKVYYDSRDECEKSKPAEYAKYIGKSDRIDFCLEMTGDAIVFSSSENR